MFPPPFFNILSTVYLYLPENSKNIIFIVSFLSDLNRTFPDNVLFRKTSDPCLQKPLYNVLLAYGHHNPSVGYCQVLLVFLHPS